MIIKKYIRPWFFENGDNKIKPIRVLLTIMLLLIIASMFMRLLNVKYIDNDLISRFGIILGTVLAADIWRRNNKDKNGGMSK